MNVGCVILAGGKSSRMGTDTALLEYDGKRFIEQIADELEIEISVAEMYIRIIQENEDM